MKKTTLIITAFLLSAVALHSQEQETSNIVQIDINKVIAIVSAESFCENITSLVAAMPTNFMKIADASSGTKSSGGWGPIATWKSEVIFDGVERKGEISYDTFTEKKQGEYEAHAYTETISHEKYTCDYLLIGGDEQAEWTKVHKGVLEVIQQCLPLASAPNWQHSTEELRSTLLTKENAYEYKIILKIGLIDLFSSDYGLILSFESIKQ